MPRNRKAAGVDLAGSPRRPSGWALLSGPKLLDARILYGDGEIISAVEAAKPELIAIDAPLSLPRAGGMRAVDREMHRRGYPVLPPAFGGMRALTERGIRLAEALRRMGYGVIEVHPTSTMKALGLGRAEAALALRRAGLAPRERELEPHEVDAIYAAITALLHLRGLTEVVECEDGAIVVPIRHGPAGGRA